MDRIVRIVSSHGYCIINTFPGCGNGADHEGQASPLTASSY